MIKRKVLGIALTGLCLSAYGQSKSDDIKQYFTGYLQGNSSCYTKSQKLQWSDVETYRAQIWQVWCEANQAFEEGYINRLSPMALPATSRNKAPSKVIKLSKGDTIQAVYGVNEKDSIRVISQSGTTEVKVSELKVGSSISTGAKVLSTRGDMIVKTHIIKTTKK